MDVLERIKQQVETHPVIIYMKGTPQLPQCGFSSTGRRPVGRTRPQATAAGAILKAFINDQLGLGGHGKHADCGQGRQLGD